MHPLEAISVSQGTIAIWWFGQSSFALKDAGGTIMQIDPYFPRVRPPEKYLHAESPLDEADLRTDYVLITHNHSDHTCVESLQRIHAAFPNARYVAPVESVTKMIEHGIPSDLITMVSAGYSVQLGTITAHAVWTKPPAGDPRANIPPPDVQHLGYVLCMGEIRVYISGDLLHTFADHDELLQPIMAHKPTIGLLTTHPTEGEFPFFDGSVRMALKLGLQVAVPAHYDCFVKRDYNPYQ